MSKIDKQTLFRADSTDAWKERVLKELKDKPYEDYLTWQSLDGFEIEAWQNQLPSNLPQIKPLAEPWKSLEPIYETDAQMANESALAALMVGAEAIWFEKSFQGAAAQVASNKIDTNIAPVFIKHVTLHDTHQNLLRNGEDIEIKLDKTNLINGLRLRQRGANAITEIALTIAQGIEIGQKIGFDKPLIFKLGYGSSFLTELAKTRALRWLWQSILKHENQEVKNPEIIACNLQIGYSKNDEHTNILRATAAGLSAIIGGAQYVMIEPWNKSWKSNDSKAKRISRNIHNLLRDESKLDKNLNQADGSYFIENLTVALAEKTWSLVQQIETKGGFSAYAKSGELKLLLETQRHQLIEAHKSGKKTLLGVNKFPNEKVVEESAPKTSKYALLPDFLYLPTTIKPKPL